MEQCDKLQYLIVLNYVEQCDILHYVLALNYVEQRKIIQNSIELCGTT